MTTTAYRRTNNVLIKLTEDQHKALSSAGWDNLELFKQGKGTHTAWFNIATRMRFALELSTRFYEEVTAVGVKIAYDVCLGVYTRAISTTPNVWTMSEFEIEHIEQVLEVLETIQRTMLRKDMAEAMRKVVSHMRSRYVKDHHLQPLPPKRLR